MSSQVSGSSSAFGQLDERIQRWIWSEGWTTLRDAQERAIPALIDADRDVIIAAATAAGKTEAAFFPILTHLLRGQSGMGSVLYISPLKALINDQWGRLNRLCDTLDVSVVGWHGDVAASKKQRFLKAPTGVLLITPESLEALFVNRGTAMPGIVAALRYMVVDELHAFIGAERGKQLQSLMHRIDRLCNRQVPRVGLSATLGDMQLAAEFLRPRAAESVEIIVSASSGQELKVLLKGYTDTTPANPLLPIPSGAQPEDEDPAIDDSAAQSIADHLYVALRGTNNLVFPNSRGAVELYADLLRDRCERDHLPNEFWAHHGNLSRELREETEDALKDGTRPATAICTTTLELGIDIGAVKSIAQIGPPPSVASLRQRLGRSGRRAGEPAILRAYCVERDLNRSSGFSDKVREHLVQSISMVRLLLQGWFEPPRANGIHASTLVQQILSVIAERGGATAAQIWAALVEAGPFSTVGTVEFTTLLRHMGSCDLLIQDSSGLLLHGQLGEKFVNHYSFYSAFMSEEEYRLVADGKTIGALPISNPLVVDQRIIFGGRRWRVLEVDAVSKVILVAPGKGGAPPQFGSGRGAVHDRVREEMRSVLEERGKIVFIDSAAQMLLDDARRFYEQASLASTALLEDGSGTLLVSWRSDWLNEALALMLTQRGITSTSEGLAIALSDATPRHVEAALHAIVAEGAPTPSDLLRNAHIPDRAKWDWALPDDLKWKSFASLYLDIDGAMAYIAESETPNSQGG